MTAQQYWQGDCQLVRYYRRAARIRQDMRNQDAWLQGAYFYEALCDASPILRAFAKRGTKPAPYRQEPYPLSAGQDKQQREQARQRQDDKAKAYMEAFALAVNKKFEQKDIPGR